MRRGIPESTRREGPSLLERVKAAADRQRRETEAVLQEAAERDAKQAERDAELQPLREGVETVVRNKSMIAATLKEVFPDRSFTEQDITKLLTDQEVMQLPKIRPDDYEALTAIATRIAEELDS